MKVANRSFERMNKLSATFFTRPANGDDIPQKIRVAGKIVDPIVRTPLVRWTQDKDIMIYNLYHESEKWRDGRQCVVGCLQDAWPRAHATRRQVAEDNRHCKVG